MMIMMSMSHPILNAGRCRCLTKYSAALRNLRCLRLFCPFLPISAHFRHFCKVSTFHCIARITKKKAQGELPNDAEAASIFWSVSTIFRYQSHSPKVGPSPFKWKKFTTHGHIPWRSIVIADSYELYIYVMSTSIIIHHHPSSSIIIHHNPSSSIIIHHHPSFIIIHHLSTPMKPPFPADSRDQRG